MWFKKISPAVFGLALICFVLPFVTVSCNGQKVMSLSGIQLMTGTSIEQPGMFGGKGQAKKVDGEPVAIIAFIAGIAGLGLSFMKNRKSSIIPAGLGLIGLIMLLVIKIRLDGQVNIAGGATMGLLSLSYGAGYWLAFILYLLASCLNGYAFWQTKAGTQDTENQT